MKKKITIVLSLYNEAEGLFVFQKLLMNVLNKLSQYDFEFIWVNDGSTDNTQQLIDTIKSKENSKNISHVTIELSKNYGHEQAITAGIDNASGDAIICMDSDGQHPPEMIPEMIEAYVNGFEIVQMNREDRTDRSLIGKIFFSLFHKLLYWLLDLKFQETSLTFFLISAQVANVLKVHFREKNRFIRCVIQSIGFSKKFIPINVPKRQYGKSSSTYSLLINYTLAGIYSFSTKPFKFIIGTSIIYIFCTFIYAANSLYNYLSIGIFPTVSTHIILFLSASFSILFIAIAILTFYFEKTLHKIRDRPIYIIKKINK